jgi:lantibiotic modifying enzyme
MAVAIGASGSALPFRLLAQEGTPAIAATTRWLDAALGAARWIRTTRVETPQGLLWVNGPERPEGKAASPELYTGTSGIVLFLVELARATGDKTYLEEAAAGADWLIATLPEKLDLEKAEDGLYTGVPGIGFALHQVAKTTGKEAYQKGAERCVDLIQAAAKPAGAGVEWGPGLDIIAGSAGTILYLLYMARELDRPSLRELALKAGLRLAELGIPEAGGKKWRFANLPDATRLMPNFSHGTAGIAYALATLVRETGRQELLETALAGGRYLQAVADTEGDGCLILHHEPEPDGRHLYYLGWCHGPAGTVRLFYQLARATGDDRWLEWVRRGVRSIQASGIPEQQTAGFWNNDGLCCGLAGVADFFLRLQRTPEMAGDAGLLAFARRTGEALLAKATREGDGLKWIQAEHRIKPDYVYAQTGYMQGAAGIGILLLHLDAVEHRKEWAFRLPDTPY